MAELNGMPRSVIPSSDYVYPTVLPWRSIFNDLHNAGCSPYRLSLLIGRGWSTVQRWVYDGIEPRESYARAILMIHSRYCGEQATQKRLQESKPLE